MSTAAKALLQDHGAIILLNSPKGMEFGIDFNFWKTDLKFKGLKLIPKGLHFVYYSTANSNFRFGFFIEIIPGKLIVKKWSDETEEFIPESDLDQISRIKQNLHEFDQGMGFYPQSTIHGHTSDTLHKWLNISSFITYPIVLDLLSNASQELQISSMSSVSRFSKVWNETISKDLTEISKTMDKSLEERNEKFKSKKEDASSQDWIHFTEIDLKSSFPPNCTPQEKTKYSIDKSYLLERILSKQIFKKDVDFLGEFQACFVMFLFGQLYDGFEQWKQIIYLISHCNESIPKHPTLFKEFISCFILQLAEFPTDFFQDEISSSSFLEECFASLLLNCREYEATIFGLHDKIDELVAFVDSQFDWDIGHGFEEMEEGEDAPVVVET